jgi:hypothetical protein
MEYFSDESPQPVLMVGLAGSINRHQQVVVELFQKEVSILHEELEGRPHSKDDQRRRLTDEGKPVAGNGLLRDCCREAE